MSLQLTFTEVCLRLALSFRFFFSVVSPFRCFGLYYMLSSGGGQVTDDLFQRAFIKGFRPHRTAERRTESIACDLWHSRKEVTGLHRPLSSRNL